MRSMKAWRYLSVQSPSLLWRFTSRIVCASVLSFSKIWFEWFNRPVTYHKERLYSAVEHRPKGRGLITVCNHHSCMDDPLLFGLSKWSYIFTGKIRWTPSAEEICFTSPSTTMFFSAGRCVPVVRGDGVYQRCMDFCVGKLNKGEWIHIFPEGFVNQEKEYKRLKWGVGRLIADSNIPPVVLPFFHLGLDSILPNRKPYIPQIGKDVTVVFGEPLDFTEDLKQLNNLNKTPMEIRKYITDKIQEELVVLRKRTEMLHGATANGTKMS